MGIAHLPWTTRKLDKLQEIPVWIQLAAHACDPWDKSKKEIVYNNPSFLPEVTFKAWFREQNPKESTEVSLRLGDRGVQERQHGWNLWSRIIERKELWQKRNKKQNNKIKLLKSECRLSWIFGWIVSFACARGCSKRPTKELPQKKQIQWIQSKYQSQLTHGCKTFEFYPAEWTEKDWKNEQSFSVG